MQPYVQGSISYIKDSQNLIQKCSNIVFPSDCKLYSCDFESLYTNIDLNHALNVISEFMSKKQLGIELNIIGFNTLLKLVFENNFFTYNENYYKQVIGIAMGTKCGPSIANIYISCLEEKYLTIHRPLAYYRFIDDIFTITEANFDINILKENFGYLKLNIIYNNIVNFLDLNISLCKLTNTISFSLYIKPTNTFSYLLTSSNHPSFIFRNIPKSLFLRIRRICTNLYDYFYFSRNLFVQLLQRGYEFNNLNKIMKMVANIEQSKLLSYKDKKQKFGNENILFITPYHSYCKDYLKELPVNFEKIKNLNLAYKNANINTVYSIQPNLFSLLIHNFKPQKSLKNFYKKCENTSCEICKYF